MTEYKITRGNTQLFEIVQAHPNDIILLDFHAVWCGPCKAIAPMLHQLTEAYNSPRGGRLILCKVDVDDQGNSDLMQGYQVRAMPTLFWIQGAQVVATVKGANSKEIQKICAELCIPSDTE